MRIRIEGISRLARMVGGAALVALTAVGCAGTTDGIGEESAAIQVSAVPDLPGCDSEGPGHTNLVGRPIAGNSGLVVVYSDGSPLCIDTPSGAAQHLGGFLVLEAASSNPMPGQPGDPAWSNPMPGEGTEPTDGIGGSNPMPGQPVASNPMPGQGTHGH